MRTWFIAILVGLAAITGFQTHAAIPLTGYADLVEQLSPAVVNVATTTKPHKVTKEELFGQQGNPFTGTPFEDFFDQFGQQFGMDNLTTAPRSSLGSGVVISQDGYVVTNYHVIDGADEIVVKFNKGREEYPAKVVGRDSKTDLALLKINVKKALPTARLGDSSKLRVGDVVLAIGNPFGLGGTVTSGIVSALGRNIGQGPYDDFIQTDAAINPGNSGGPLFNAAGEVVGINSAIFTRSGASNGIGFAIPVNTVKMTVEQLKMYGKPVRGWLGVRVQQINKDLADGLKLKEDVGALISEVVPESPGARSGLRTGDVIISYNGQAITQMSDLPRHVAETPIGTSVPVNIIRGGKPMVVQVKIAQMKEDEDKPSHAERTDDSSSSDHAMSGLGLTVQPLDNDIRERLNVPNNVTGMVVMAVHGSAQEAGLVRGDVIVEAGMRPIRTVADLRNAMNGKGTIILRIYRNDGFLFLPFKK